MNGDNQENAQNQPEATTSMADMESYENSFKSLKIGEYIQGKILRIDTEGVWVALTGKADGFIPSNEISENYSAASDLKVGDVVDALVIQKKDGEIILSKKRADRELGWKRVVEAYEKGEIITATCVETVKGGLIVDIGVRGFVPASQADIRPIRELTDLMGEEMRLKIIELDTNKKKVVLSRRIVMEAEREKSKEAVFSLIHEGDIKTGKVERITDFGAFVNLGGIDGLIHISELSWKRVGKPSDVVSVGEMVEVRVLKVEPEKNKVSLSLRQAKPDPWLVADEKFPTGTQIEGTVTKLAKNYAFIEVTDGIEGLIPISEISHERISKPEDKLSLGQKVTVRVLEVKGKDRRMLLSMKEESAPAKEKAKSEFDEYISDRPSSITIGDMIRSKEGKGIAEVVADTSSVVSVSVVPEPAAAAPVQTSVIAEPAPAPAASNQMPMFAPSYTSAQTPTPTPTPIPIATTQEPAPIAPLEIKPALTEIPSPIIEI